MLRDSFNKLHEDNLEVESIIKAVQPELDEMAIRIIDIFKDVFPVEATENGIEQWEELLQIIANPLTEDIEFRRQRIILRLSAIIPFTERFMQNYFDTVLGAENWEYKLDYDKYSLQIIVLYPSTNWRIEVNKFFEIILPCNIRLSSGELLESPELYFNSVLIHRSKSLIPSKNYSEYARTFFAGVIITRNKSPIYMKIP